MALIHSQTGYVPKIYPHKNGISAGQIDRAQDLDPTVTLNREKVEELGRDGTVTWVKQVPSTGASLTQLEYGNIKFFRKLACKGNSVKTLTLNDFKDSYFDIAAHLTDDNGNYQETVLYPKHRLSNFSINIGDPESRIERSFDFVGEDAKVLQGSNKYYVRLDKTVASGEAGSVDIVIGSGGYSTYPSPVEDPNNTGKYFIQAFKYDGSTTTTELTEGTDYTYDSGTTTITISSAAVGEVYTFYYTASSYISGSNYWTNNDADSGVLMAHSASLYVGTSNYLYKLQSATIDADLDRNDLKEIGSKEVQLRGVSNKTVTVTLGRILDARTIEEVMSGKAANYGILEPDIFSSNLTFIAAFYDTASKSNFKIGFKATGMTPSEFRPGSASIDNYVDVGNTLECENLTITNDKTTLGI